MPATSNVDKVALEIAAEVWKTNGLTPLALMNDEFFLGTASIPVQAAIYKKWETADSDRVRMLGLVGLVGIGDAVAINLIADGRQDYRQIELPTKMSMNGVIGTIDMNILGFKTYEGAVALVLSNLSHPGSDTVLALGAVTKNTGLSLKVRRAAVHALWMYHDKASAKQLSGLLSSDDAELRSFAMAGLSYYAFGVPPWTPGAPMDFSLTNSDRELMHHAVMGPGVNAPNEKELLSYWTQWSSTHLSAP